MKTYFFILNITLIAWIIDLYKIPWSFEKFLHFSYFRFIEAKRPTYHCDKCKYIGFDKTKLLLHKKLHERVNLLSAKWIYINLKTGKSKQISSDLIWLASLSSNNECWKTPRAAIWIMNYTICIITIYKYSIVFWYSLKLWISFNTTHYYCLGWLRRLQKSNVSKPLVCWIWCHL